MHLVCLTDLNTDRAYQRITVICAQIVRKPAKITYKMTSDCMGQRKEGRRMLWMVQVQGARSSSSFCGAGGNSPNALQPTEAYCA
jgi:hypothetical protein